MAEDIIGTTVPHSDFGAVESCGCLNGIIRGEEAKILFNECEKVVRTVSKKPTYNALSMKWNCRWASPALNARIPEPYI
jgi:hypothetical protein